MPKKRKAEKVASSARKIQRLKGLYNNDYRELLNRDIRTAVLQDRPDQADKPLVESQIGASVWTSVEKELFFGALVSLGKDNVRGIATRIRTKSALQVQEYMTLLHRGMVEKNLNEPRQQLLGIKDVPAAFQISQECCDALEASADALALRQERHEESLEKAKWGESWLLTHDVNDWVEEHLTEEGGTHALHEMLPAADLLNLGNWLELSTRIFMNPAAPREMENWQSMIEPGEEPGIRATAFSDFHTLAVSLTRRLVSATLFCAMSRLRATDSDHSSAQGNVKRADVHAAAMMLGLELDSTKFWTGCARRCNLDIHQNLSATVVAESEMHHDDVERILSQVSKPRQRPLSPGAARSDDMDSLVLGGPFESSAAESSEQQSPETSNYESSSAFASEDEDDPDHHSALDIERNLASEYMAFIHNGPLDPSDSEFETPKIHAGRMKRKVEHTYDQERAVHQYMEALDIKTSLGEEKKLWHLLKQDPPFAINPEDIEVPEPPVQDRKESEELIDWRDRLEYWSEWEVFKDPVPLSTFSERDPDGGESYGKRTQSQGATDVEVDGPGADPINDDSLASEGGSS
ncbi:MAG: hypothetical protein M1818_006263 [Claussenomyces sp. TS43310]|nr:MAG: hypothetical protein M1818_006263 [Claussenomyces sp. TS43310]